MALAVTVAGWGQEPADTDWSVVTGNDASLGFTHRGAAYWKDPDVPGEGAGRDDWRIETPALRAFDKTTGELVGEIALPAHTDGSPVTFLHRGRQYLVFALGGRGAPFELIAYRLPIQE